MTHGTGSSSIVAAMSEQSPHSEPLYGASVAIDCPERASPNDGQGLHRLTSEQRRAAIERAGCAMEAAYAKFKQSHSPVDLDRAHHHLLQMLTLAGIQPRSQE